MNTYGHMCRDERHAEVGYNLSDDDERCPVCRVLDDLDYERRRWDAANERVERFKQEIEFVLAYRDDNGYRTIDCVLRLRLAKALRGEDGRRA